MLRELLAVTLILAGLGLLGWMISAPDRALPALPVAAGGLATGLWLFLLHPGGGERK
jgi:hypothetical protein